MKTGAHDGVWVQIMEGVQLGELIVADAGGELVERVPLVALAAVPRGGLWARAWDSVALMFR